MWPFCDVILCYVSGGVAWLWSLHHLVLCIVQSTYNGRFISPRANGNATSEIGQSTYATALFHKDTLNTTIHGCVDTQMNIGDIGELAKDLIQQSPPLLLYGAPKAPLAKSGGVILIVPASWNNMFVRMETHAHGRTLEVEFKNQYNTAHILIIVTYPPPRGKKNSPHDSRRNIICNSIKCIDRDFSKQNARTWTTRNRNSPHWCKFGS